MEVDFADTIERIMQLEKELEQEIKKKNHEIIKSYQKQKIRFEESIRKQQEKYRVHLLRYVFSARLRSIIVAPIIYFMVIPISIFDVSIFIYQHITFRFYGIPLVIRKDYITIDRHHLGYLNLLENSLPYIWRKPQMNKINTDKKAKNQCSSYSSVVII